MDVIWTGEFANAGWLDPVPESIRDAVTKKVFASVLETASFDDTLYAAPIWSNTQLLWYRKDRVKKPPRTWEEMIREARRLGPNQGLIEVQANFYEGLTVWATTMIESAGSPILAGPTEVALEQGPTEQALSVMAELSRSPVADPSVTTSNEDTARLGFETGQAAFMVNYPFVFPSAEENAPDVAKVMRAAKYPRVVPDRESAPPLGGINLGVSAFSENPDLAWEAVECLIQPQNQLEIASKGGLPPVRTDLYERKAIDKVYPGFADLIRSSIQTATPRPSESPAYQDLTLAIQRAIHPTDDIDPQDPTPTYEDLVDKLNQAVDREGVL
jgi:multiple sugar transport system substrate-binding protein